MHWIKVFQKYIFLFFFLNFLFIKYTLSFAISSDELPKLLSLTKNLDLVNKNLSDKDKYFVGQRVFLDNLEENQFISVFNKPGYNWHTCDKENKNANIPEEQKCKPIGWLNRNNFVFTISKKSQSNAVYEVKSSLPVRDLEVVNIVSYSLIYFNYSRAVIRNDISDFEVHENEGFGWVPTDYLSNANENDKPKEPFYPNHLNTELGLKSIPQTSLSAKIYPQSTFSSPRQEYTEVLNDTIESTEVNGKSSILKNKFQNLDTIDKINYISEIIKPFVGKCYQSKYYLDKNPPLPFDVQILKDLLSVNLEALGLDGIISSEDLITIDALTRTLYGEMGICFRKGLQYPMAVARVALNRSKSNKLNGFITKLNHDLRKSNLAKIATVPSQFNAWIPKKKIRLGDQLVNTNAFSQTMCPPSNPNETFYTGYNPGREELNIWTNALKIAIETVVYSDFFEKRTPGICGTHFTSGLGLNTFHGMTKLQTHPVILGRAVSDESCVQLWVDENERRCQ